ncbi:Serine/threonine-protein kinase fray2 [Camellia lanceoleosa]|uniref:Serine/threonine-protein kinase fray2 n=1 Tax=Camellia lanceoleosa TaxID=1840588 RepID=A0ACC0IAW7_9ERIC|nr:Serine/threonine-protein kinase fray2 [Camellia lanceoleosa]
MVGGCFSTANYSTRDVRGGGDGSVKEMARLFGEMVAACLSQLPSQRPTVSKLMDHEFFRRGDVADHLLVQEFLTRLRGEKISKEGFMVIK